MKNPKKIWERLINGCPNTSTEDGCRGRSNRNDFGSRACNVPLYVASRILDRLDLPGEHLQNFHPICEGIMRIVIFILYVTIVGMQKDIKRTFMYHGSEQKYILS